MTDYTKLEQEVDAQGDTIWDMASHVWEFAELGYWELKSSAYEAEVLEKNGFKISDRGIGGCETSWIATWGNGSPVLGLLVEFDALPGLGNDTVPTKTPKLPPKALFSSMRASPSSCPENSGAFDRLSNKNA